MEMCLFYLPILFCFVSCSFRPYCQPLAAEKLQLNSAKEELSRKVEKEMDARSTQALRSHQQKILENEDKVNQVKARLGQDARSAKKVKEEISALEHKHEELIRQKEEFVRAVDGFRKKLHVLLEKDGGYEGPVQGLRKQVGIEVCRLQKALPMYARRQEIVGLVMVSQDL
jgi:septal ring factor EnvC (AmiA/AmiB activator)